MKFMNIALSSALATTILAYPGAGKWKNTLSELERRAATPIDSPEDSNELLGDLLTAGPTTPVGKLVADLLVGNADALTSEIITAASAPLGSDACKKDTCCTWKYVADEMLATFRGQSLRCNNFARGAIRLGFHDAAAWEKGADYGGADGSILLTDELSRPVNKGLEEIAAMTKQMYAKYQPYGISMADFIQMGATVATVACPLGPRIRSFVGRKDNPTAAIEDLLPDVNDDADSLIELFEDKTIRAHGLTALLGAHTTSQQRFFNPERALDPQDSTPGVWDVAVYPQTLDPNAPKRVLKFPSDVKISVHPRTASEWKAFADPTTGQAHWNDDYAKEYIRLSMLGVNNINALTECSKVLPPATPDFQPPDKSNVDIWANGGYQNLGSKFGELMAGASLTTNQTLPQLGVDPMQAWSGFGRQPPGPPSAQPGSFPGQGQQGPPSGQPSGLPGQGQQDPRPSFPSGRPLPAKANAPAGSVVAPFPSPIVSSAVAPVVSAPVLAPSAALALKPSVIAAAIAIPALAASPSIAPANQPAVAAPVPVTPVASPPQANWWTMAGRGMGQGWSYPSPPANSGGQPQGGEGQGGGRGRQGGILRKLRLGRDS